MATAANRLPKLTGFAKKIEDLRYTLSNALIITRREVRDSFRDWRIIVPIFILTFMFPGLAQFVAGRFSSFVAGFGAEVIGERTIPFLLMIVGFFPISISLVIALETFVGEKERRSLEPLLSTPLTNTELYIGKTLAAMIPPLLSSFGGMLVYLSSLLFSELAWRPQPMLIFQIMVMTTVQALVMVTGAVVVSSQTTSTRAANLLASFIIIPMALVIQGESVIMFLAPDAESPNGISALWAIIVGMLFVVVLLLRVGNSIFNREELLGRSIDQLNLKTFFKKIWVQIRAVDEKGTPAANLKEWYLRGMRLSLSRLGTAFWVTILVFIVAFAAGYIVGLQPEYRLPLDRVQRLGFGTTLTDVADQYLNVGFQARAAIAIFIQNGRVLLAALILAIFTFGVGALVISPAVYAILGYVTAQIILANYSLWIVIAAFVPHGLVEIPVIVIAIAAALRVGAVVTRPPQDQTVGQAWTVSMGDALKIMIGLVIPGLMLGAFIEAFITPRIVLAVLGNL